MQRDTELELIERSLANIAARGPVMAAEFDARVDARRYFDPERFALERERVLLRSPSLVAHVSTLRSSGDFLTLDYSGQPLLLVRDGETVRAFLNVCRHRGARVELRAQGSCKRFVCPYHAWSYSHAGELVHLRHREGFPSLDPRERGLVQLPCIEIGGFVFVSPSADAPTELEASFPPVFAAELRALEAQELAVVDTQVHSWRANWKLIADGGLESYHFKVAHGRSIAKYFIDTASEFEFFGPHTRSVLPRANFGELSEQPRERRRLRSYANVLYSLFPSASLLVQADHIVMIVTVPEAVDRTRIEISTLAPREQLEGERAEYWAANHALTVRTLAEDFELGEQIQAGLTSGANQDFMLGRYEGALVQLHTLIDGLL